MSQWQEKTLLLYYFVVSFGAEDYIHIMHSVNMDDMLKPIFTVYVAKSELSFPFGLLCCNRLL